MGYFSEDPIVFQDLLTAGGDLENRYEEYNRLVQIVQRSNEIYRRTLDSYIVIKEHQQNPNWIKEGF